MKLNDQVALVTGAAGGIGRELARQLAAAGCHLALADVDEAGLEGLKRELRTRPVAVSLHKADVAEEQAVKGLVGDVVRIHRRASILINNAGVSISAPFEEIRPGDYERLMGTNFWGAVYSCRHALPVLRQGREARIVNVLSGFALLGFPHKVSYCSSKAALLGFSNALYTELHGTGVRVSVAIPPAVDTNLVRNGVAYDEAKKQREVEFLARNAMPVEKVARGIIAGMVRGDFRIRIGLSVRILDVMCRWFPTLTHTVVAGNSSRIGFL
jgi:NAD(P)-dependent dehydrogenase (short-subunit alcohol dehydrogenase family)